MTAYSYLNGANVFLTGHTGFKGSWMCHLLTMLGAKVTGYALPPENKSHFNAAQTSTLVNSLYGDINEAATLGAAMQTCNPDFIIHMAAQPLVRLSYVEPISTLATNIIGTANVLEAARACPNVKTIAVITSDKCYENEEREEGYVESDAMGGHDPYSASKGAAELVAASYAKSFLVPAGINLVTLRGGNVIGGGDWSQDRLMTDIVQSLSRAQAPTLRNPYALRPWQFVIDVLTGYLSAMQFVTQSGAQSESGVFDSYNIGPQKSNVANVEKVAGLSCALWGHDMRQNVHADANAPHEATLLQLNIDKALRDLEWHPSLDIEASVQQTIDWYKAFYDGQNMSAFTKNQLTDFLKD